MCGGVKVVSQEQEGLVCQKREGEKRKKKENRTENRGVGN